MGTVSNFRSPTKTDSRNGNGSEPPMEARIAKLEASVSHIENDIKDIKLDIRDIRKDASTDFRILFSSIIATALGLAGIMAKGFHWL